MSKSKENSQLFLADKDIKSGRPNSLLVDGKAPQPAWYPQKGRYGGDLRAVYSIKLQRRVYLCFYLEYYAWILLECDPQVVTFCEHPLKDEVSIGEKTVSTTFDMWVLFRSNREELREVKPSDKKGDGSERPQIKAQKILARLKGLDYRVLTENDVQRKPLLNNCRRLYPYLAQHPGGDWERRVLTLIDNKGEVPLRNLTGTSNLETQKLWHAAFHLVVRGELYAPLADVTWDQLTLRRPDDELAQQPLT